MKSGVAGLRRTFRKGKFLNFVVVTDINQIKRKCIGKFEAEFEYVTEECGIGEKDEGDL